jgi:CTP:molybdopterin cytidylyltransferase MocA
MDVGEDDEVAGILLAAGEGRRFGRPKALVVLGGRSLVERGAATLSAGGCRPVLVVLGGRLP